MYVQIMDEEPDEDDDTNKHNSKDPDKGKQRAEDEEQDMERETDSDSYHSLHDNHKGDRAAMVILLCVLLFEATRESLRQANSKILLQDEKDENPMRSKLTRTSKNSAAKRVSYFNVLTSHRAIRFLMGHCRLTRCCMAGSNTETAESTLDWTRRNISSRRFANIARPLASAMLRSLLTVKQPSGNPCQPVSCILV